MGLWHQVQMIEQRLLMMERMLIEIALHINPEQRAGAPVYRPFVPPATGFFGPRRQTSYVRPDEHSNKMQHEIGFDAFVSSEVDPDIASLDASLEGASETSVSSFGTTDYGADDGAQDLGGFGDDGDFGGGDGGDGD